MHNIFVGFRLDSTLFSFENDEKIWQVDKPILDLKDQMAQAKAQHD